MISRLLPSRASALRWGLPSSRDPATAEPICAISSPARGTAVFSFPRTLADLPNQLQSFCSTRRFRWEMLEHLLHALFELPDVAVGFGGNCVACGSPPDQHLGISIEHINHQRSNGVCLLGGGRRSEPSAPPPA